MKTLHLWSLLNYITAIDDRQGDKTEVENAGITQVGASLTQIAQELARTG